MKFIRTKEGRIIDLRSATKRQYEAFLHAYEVIKKSYKLDELCDYCICRNCDGELVIRKLPLSTSWDSVVRNMKTKWISDVRLAIVTDKGIIYVAKMNEEGEWKLL